MARYKERNDDIRVIGSDKVKDRYYGDIVRSIISVSPRRIC